jgi:cold shock CspA family protein
MAFDSATGVVASFDEPRGLGVITTTEGVEVPFHCTEIADGTRTIAVGTAVRYDVVAGRLGRWEATALTPLAPRQ